MANVKQIEVNGIEYDIVQSGAIEDISLATLNEAKTGNVYGSLSINEKGNVAIESLSKHVNIEAVKGIQLKPTTNIIIDTSRRKAAGQGNEAHLEVVFDDKKKSGTADDSSYGEFKLHARNFDIRCHDHGGIALQPCNHDGSGHENKIKFESSRTSEINAPAEYSNEGGKGLEFGTFNNLHTSIYTGDYRFKGDASVFPATRDAIEMTSTGKIDYPTQADDFKDKINNANSATWNEIVNVARKYADGDIQVDLTNYYTKSETDDRIATAITEASDIVVVDNLNSDSSVRALSAKQGKVLKEMIEDLGGAHNAYDSIEKVAPYLYSVNYSNIDYDYAYEYFNTHFTEINGGCSAIRSGNFFGRNYDWTYDNTATFVIRTPHEKNRAASIAVCAGITELTDTFVESREYSELYKLLPFRTLDGINEYGLFCNDNVVPKGEAGSGITTTGTNPAADTSVCMLMLPRYILDHYKTANEAIADLSTNINVYAPISDKFAHYEIHFLIGDAQNTYIVEYIDNKMVVVDFKDVEKAYYNKPYMTNFFIAPLHDLNPDGTITRNTDSSVNQCGVTKYGAGIERYNILAQGYNDASTRDGMLNLMKSIRYTNSYKDETSPRWNSELVADYTEYGYEDLTVTSPDEKFDPIYTLTQEWYNNRTRIDGSTWQTVTCSIYDLENKTLTVLAQESDNEHKFDFKEYYTAAEIDEKIVSIDSINEIKEYTDDVKDYIFFSKNDDGSRKNLKLDVKDLSDTKVAIEAIKDIELTTVNNIVECADKIKIFNEDGDVDNPGLAMVEVPGGLSMGETPSVSFLSKKVSAKAAISDVPASLQLGILNNFSSTTYLDTTTNFVHLPMETTVLYTAANTVYIPTNTKKQAAYSDIDATIPVAIGSYFVSYNDATYIVTVEEEGYAKKNPKNTVSEPGYENIIFEPIDYIPDPSYLVLPAATTTIIDSVSITDIIELVKHKNELLALLNK